MTFVSLSGVVGVGGVEGKLDSNPQAPQKEGGLMSGCSGSVFVFISCLFVFFWTLWAQWSLGVSPDCS